MLDPIERSGPQQLFVGPPGVGKKSVANCREGCSLFWEKNGTASFGSRTNIRSSSVLSQRTCHREPAHG